MSINIVTDEQCSLNEDTMMDDPYKISNACGQDSGIGATAGNIDSQSQMHRIGNDPYGLPGAKGATAAIRKPHNDVGVDYHEEQYVLQDSTNLSHANMRTSHARLQNMTGLKFGDQTSQNSDDRTFVPPPRIPPRARDQLNPIRQSYNDVGTTAGQRKPIVMPDKFDGSGVWADYLAHFEICSTINRWGDHEKATFLAVSLRGTAQMILGDLTTSSLNSYPVLVTELQSRFGQEGQSELYRTQLKNRLKRQEESFPELGQEIKRWTAQAYPDAPSVLRDTLAKGHFVDALNDSDMRMHIYHRKPRSLTEAIHMATEWQAFKRAEVHRASMRRPVHAANVLGSISDPTMEEMRKQLTEMKSELDKIKNPLNKQKYSEKYEPTQHTPHKSFNHQNRDPNKRVCWGCGEQGHFQNRCPKQDTNNSHSRQTQNQGNWK